MNQHLPPDETEGGDGQGADDADGDGRLDRFLERVPLSFVTLGAGCLFAATFVSLVGAVYGWYSVATGRTYGYPSYALVLLSVEFTFVTLLQAVATVWALQRRRWLWVMLAAFFGVFVIVTLPLDALALVGVGLGVRHFASHTPASELLDAFDDADDGAE